MVTQMDPTARADAIAHDVRNWYEQNRESWWRRLWRNSDQADEFMLSLVQEVKKAESKYSINK